MKFGPNEEWKKVFGPVFVYLNSLTNEGGQDLLWEDAKNQVSHQYIHVEIAVLFVKNQILVQL